MSSIKTVIIGGTMSYVDHLCQGLGNLGYLRLRSTLILTTSHRQHRLLLLPSHLCDTNCLLVTSQTTLPLPALTRRSLRSGTKQYIRRLIGVRKYGQRENGNPSFNTPSTSGCPLNFITTSRKRAMAASCSPAI